MESHGSTLGDRSRSTLVAVCTYNERDNIDELLQRVRRAVPQATILVIDDNSPDGTGQRAMEWADRDPQLRVVVRPGKLGLGTAIALAIEQSISGKYLWLVNLDGDLSHDPADIPRLLQAAQPQTGRAPDVVIGSRYIPGGQIVGWPWTRRTISKALNTAARGLLRLNVYDASGAFRCYRVAALERLDRDTLRARGYALLEELLWHLQRQGCHFVEIPITFTERTRGNSKLSWREAWGALQMLVQLSLRR
jgi:dolichol-phosphate mannosyltransferase